MIKESLKKSLEIVRGSTPVFIFLFVFNVLCGLSLNIINHEKNEISALRLLIVSIIMMFPYLFLHAGTLAYVRDQISLKHPTLSEFLSKARKYFLSITLFNLIIFIQVVILAIFCGICFALIAYSSEFPRTDTPSSLLPILILIGVVAGTLGFLLLSSMLFASTVIVVEDSKIFKAVKKSAKVMYNHFWKTCGLTALSILPLILLSVSNRFSESFAGNVPMQATMVVVNALTTAFFEIYCICVIMLCYFKMTPSAQNQQDSCATGCSAESSCMKS